MDKLKFYLQKIMANKELIKRILILIGIILIVIFIFFGIIKMINKKITYTELENLLIKETNNYLNDFPNLKPTATNPQVDIDVQELITNKYLKNLNKYVKDTCSAYVTVLYKNTDLDYQAYLNCNKFKTEKLSTVLDNKNTILSSTGEGVYNLGNYKVFRGQNPNNYLTFADMNWRIVKYDDNAIYLIIDNANTSMYKTFGSLSYSGVWDDRYNSEFDLRVGINDFNVSIGFDKIKTLYNAKFLNYQEYLTPFNLCVGSRNEDSNNKGGMEECSNILTNQNIGLLPIYDYLNASTSNLCQTTKSPECQNYNYLNNGKDSWWTMTPNIKNTSDIYYVNSSGLVNSDHANNIRLYRIVVALKGNILYSKGDGTLENPYEIR